MEYIIITLVIFLLATEFLPKNKTWSRTTVVSILFAMLSAYIVWRFGYTIHNAWNALCFGIEMLALTELSQFLLILSRYSNRSIDADNYEKLMKAEQKYPSVDVFIPTYNEGMEVVEKTIVGALGMVYPNYRVFVLDDGKREWLKEFCREKGAHYITRENNLNAKAGNINNALIKTDSEFIAIFDADFVPRKNFLMRTVGFFKDPKIAIVQTPQYFYNKDPIQSNLNLYDFFPDEQRMFFDAMAPGRDAWNCSFSCGSCSVTRRSILEELGGLPVDTVTEDLQLSIDILQKGYITRYLREELSMGLAAESLDAYFIQRQRWCKGALQSLFQPNNPFKKMTWVQKYFFMPFGWLFQSIVRFVLISVPLVYLATGMAPITATVSDIISYQIPVFMALMLSIIWLTDSKFVPVVSNAVSLFTSIKILPVVISTLIHPYDKKFVVTPKGKLSKFKICFSTLLFSIIMLTSYITLLSLNIDTLLSDNFFIVILLWCIYDMMVLLIVFVLSFEPKKIRAETRFKTDVICEVRDFQNKADVELVNISLTGLMFYCPSCTFSIGQTITGIFPGFTIKGRFVRIFDGYFGIHFDEIVNRDELIKYLYTDSLSNTVQKADFLKSFKKILGKMF